ncbi:hypothetical protein GUJ93_ZPchr0004g39664 [Zizania palustris]|uniref:Uncharacterized protein n=1 Tax=Zizania palustris TaxID=103762 RepID=A0A8J5T0Q7_ZIZPA|nr:hypothetical protein GUJ93_ZPchr0004g39664 [Zizania palustris]
MELSCSSHSDPVPVTAEPFPLIAASTSSSSPRSCFSSSFRMDTSLDGAGATRALAVSMGMHLRRRSTYATCCRCSCGCISGITTALDAVVRDDSVEDGDARGPSHAGPGENQRLGRGPA